MVCVGVLVGDDGSCVCEVWLIVSVRLCVASLFGCVYMCVCVFCVLLAVVSKKCVRRGSFRRLPALKTLVVFCSWERPPEHHL